MTAELATVTTPQPLPALSLVADRGDRLRAGVAGYLLQYENPRTRESYRADLADFAVFCGEHGLGLDGVWAGDISAYLRHQTETRGLTTTTALRRLSTVSGMFRYLVRAEELLTRNPCEWVRRPKANGESQTLGLDKADVRALLAAARHRRHGARDYALLHLLITDGLRVSEATGLDVEDLGTQRGHRTVRVLRKGGKQQVVPLSPQTAAAIDAYLDGRETGPLWLSSRGLRLGRVDVSRMLKATAKAAGIPHPELLHPHSLRHAFVTLALDAGASLRDVQDAAGHADPRTTRRYDRDRNSLDRHPAYVLASLVSD